MESFKAEDLKRLEKNVYDFAIVGSNFHCWLLAYSLSRVYHKKVAVLEPRESLGDSDSPLKSGSGELPSHFNKVLDNTESRESLQWLQEVLRETLHTEALEITPLTVDSGKLTPFVGFGEQHFSSMDILNSFSSSDNVELLNSPSHWLEQLASLFIGDVYTMAEITKIETSENQLKSIVINGSYELKTENLIYGLPPKTLKNLVSNEIIADKTFQKILKTKAFSCVRLHLEHPPEAQVEAHPYHILYGNKDDFDPIVGQFFKTENRLFSMWACWMLSDLIDDHEHLGSMLKHIKKQIKRAYPHLLDNLKQEKIVVEIDSEGQGNTPEALERNLAKVQGFWICHPQVLQSTGFIAKINCARKTLVGICNALHLAPGEILLADTALQTSAPDVSL